MVTPAKILVFLPKSPYSLASSPKKKLTPTLGENLLNLGKDRVLVTIPERSDRLARTKVEFDSFVPSILFHITVAPK